MDHNTFENLSSLIDQIIEILSDYEDICYESLEQAYSLRDSIEEIPLEDTDEE